MRYTNHTSRWLMPMALLILIAALTMPHMAMAAVIKLSGTMPAFGFLQSFKISPDGQYVVYRADQDTDGMDELYSVPLSGGTAVKLNGALVTGGDVSSRYYISPDSSRVVYRADQETDDVYELYSVPIAGPASAGVKLNPTLPTGGNVQHEFEISPDSSRVVYYADQDSVRTVYGGVYELYSVPIAGPASAGVKINHPLRFEVRVCMPGEHVYADDVTSFKISPDSSRVIYRAKRYEDCSHIYEVFSVSITGPPSAAIKLNDALVTGGDVSSSFKISPDSGRVVYLADQDTNQVDELYSVPIVGPASSGVKINGPLVPGGDVDFYEISPDSTRVVYRADQDTDDVWELYSVPITGPAGAAVKISGPMVPGGYVYTYDTRFKISPDSSWVVYRADQDTYDVWELYSVPITGPSGTSVKLNGPMVPGGDVDFQPSYQISPDSSLVVYLADQDTYLVWELYAAELAAPTPTAYEIYLPIILKNYPP